MRSTKRFGARYGRKTRKVFEAIEEKQRKKYPCPYCQKMRVKRVALGIWHCLKCGKEFAGKAYQP